MKIIEKLSQQKKPIPEIINESCNKINELVDAFNQGKEQPEEVSDVVVAGIFSMRISLTDDELIIESDTSIFAEYKSFDKKQAQELLSKITRLVESMD